MRSFLISYSSANNVYSWQITNESLYETPHAISYKSSILLHYVVCALCAYSHSDEIAIGTRTAAPRATATSMKRRPVTPKEAKVSPKPTCRGRTNHQRLRMRTSMDLTKLHQVRACANYMQIICFLPFYTKHSKNACRILVPGTQWDASFIILSLVGF